MKLSTIFLLPATFILSSSLFAQNAPKIKYGDVKPADFDATVYSIDSSANAVYLYDVGSSHYEGNTDGFFNVVYERHARIRLINKNGFDLASIEIPLYKYGIQEEKLVDLDAATYNIEGGKVVATKLDKGSIFKDKMENGTNLKFTFPNLKEGSIIEYDYKVSTPDPSDINPWSFQGVYPRLWSEYSVTIPSFFNFITLTQGYLNYVVDTAVMSTENYYITDRGRDAETRSSTSIVPANTFYHRWAEANVPSLKEEEFTTTVRNHVSKIEFQLNSYQFPNGPYTPVMQSWYAMDSLLMNDEDFGHCLKEGNNWLNDDVKKITATASGDEAKIKAIYDYVKNTFSCTDNDGKYLSQPIKKTYQAQKGNVADINMLLAAMIKNAGYEVVPVLLSTRDHGKTYDLYPIMSKFNYVIAEVKTANKNYFLDASDPDLGFNHLGMDCYNGSAREITNPPLIINLSADSLTETKLTTVFMMNTDDGLSASYSSQLGEQESQSVRHKLKKTTTEDFFKDLKKSYPTETEIANTEIDSLKIPEEPITLKYEIKIKPEDDVFYFSPLLAEAYKENPFKAATRLYPVEMPSCSNETYILNMEIPKGYSVEELPKSARVMLNENEGMFEYIIGQSGNSIQLRCRIIIKKANFEPDDYSTLRDFFGYIVKKEAEQIVFKKQ